MAMNANYDDAEIELESEADDQFEDIELETDEATTKDKLNELRKKLKESEAKRAETLEDLQRAKAEFLNVRKRLEEETYRDRDRQVNNFIEKLTPLADSFSMAMSDKTAWEAIDKNWRVGIESIYGQLQSLLKDYAVLTINETGVVFDPNRHEAVATIPVENKEQDHKVISIIQTGYERVVNGKAELIRPARVTVGEHSGN